MFLALCAAESGLLFLLLSIYRGALKPDLSSFVSSPPGIVFVVSVVIILHSVWWMVYTFKTRGSSKTKYSMMAAGMNVLMLFLLIASAEMLFRSLSKDSEAGEALFGIVLCPRQWGAIVARQHAVLDKTAAEGTYNIYDEHEGWTIALSYSNKSREEFSSREGLRSPRPEVSFADSRSRYSGRAEQPASVRIALIRDSMTYRYEVRCEESWGHALKSHLQPSAQVLNFAVAAYGLNQVFLRYENEVRPWHPHIVIIGVSSEMIRRINNIYPVLMNPGWAGFPFLRPRLMVTDGALTIINSPLPTPEEILTHSTVSTLPYLNLDDYYIRSHWTRGGSWSLLEGSYIFRFLYSLRPPSDLGYMNRRENAVQSSQVVLQYLVGKILNDGSTPLLVYFPYKREATLPTKPGDENSPLLLRVLRNSGFQFLNPSSCLKDAEISAAHAKGGHYSPRGTTYIARCLFPVVEAAMKQL